MSWKDIIKEAELTSVQDTISAKPQEQEENCLRKIKNLVKRLKRIKEIPFNAENLEWRWAMGELL